jgi:hypothetical protein
MISEVMSDDRDPRADITSQVLAVSDPALGGTGARAVMVIDVATQRFLRAPSCPDCSSIDVCSHGSVLITLRNPGRVRRLRLDESGTLTDR